MTTLFQVGLGIQFHGCIGSRGRLLLFEDIITGDFFILKNDGSFSSQKIIETVKKIRTV